MSLPFRALGLGGGGMKGILHIGALLELEKHQPLKFPDGVYGCSVGSIIAAFIAFELPIKNIIPFVRKNLSIDMTIVSGNPSDLDSEEENTYQIEFEIVDPQKVSDTNTLYNIVYKVNDVLDLA
jgi:predicted acylesterase/phospholipase RssA